jgi:undecaprenyl-diphosphatase
MTARRRAAPSGRNQAGPGNQALWALAAILALGFVPLSVAAHAQTRFAWDLPLTRWLQDFRSPWLDAVMRAVSWPGFPPQWLLMFAAVAGAMLLAGWRLEVLLMAAAELAVGLFGFALKDIVARPRPPGSLVWVDFRVNDPYTYTAGHVHTGMVMFGWAAYLLLAARRGGEGVRATVLGIAAIAFLVLTGISRVYLGEHWPSDVLGAVVLGGIGLLLEVLAYRRWRQT